MGFGDARDDRDVPVHVVDLHVPRHGELDAVPEDGRGLAVSHTPLIERAVLGLSAREIEPLAECEGVLLSKADDGSPVEVEELRLPS